MKERVVTQRVVEAEAAEEAAARAASPWRVPVIVGSAVLALLSRRVDHDAAVRHRRQRS